MNEARDAAAGRKTCSINQACAQAWVSRKTLYTWMANGKVDFVMTPSGARRIFIDSLFRQPSGDRMARE